MGRNQPTDYCEERTTGGAECVRYLDRSFSAEQECALQRDVCAQWSFTIRMVRPTHARARRLQGPDVLLNTSEFEVWKASLWKAGG